MAAPSPAGFIDAVDEQNHVVGVVQRRDVFRLQASFRTVHVLVFNDRDDLLLQRLAETGTRHPGRWGSSVAGYLHAGEKYAEAAQRRLSEELGLTTPLVELGVTPMVDEGTTKFVGVFTTSANHPRNTARYQIDEIRFFPLPVVEKLVSSHPHDYTDTFRHVLSFWREMS